MKRILRAALITLCFYTLFYVKVPAITMNDSHITAYSVQQSLVPINKLANKTSLKKSCTNAEFQQAYNTASFIVTPLIGLERQTQVICIAQNVRALADYGYVQYTTNAKHYNDPYGYFVAGVASCAGATRATGLCLNMLGIPYEHVHENQWSHQWARVPMTDGTFWIVDPYGLYVGPEPASYTHPY